MEKYFGNAYRGDPGVPHTDHQRFYNIWFGSAAFSVLAYINPYIWHFPTSQWSWHDRAIIYEQYQWKKAMRENKPYEPLWNKMYDKEMRDNFYFNWPIYFP
ncbi:hypothetical protein RIF29_20395 [Crotalaria pallida]|uniref:Uncharacterized protein n=1 Tax=Crotalaria pallida TaxID=3830 RepID=A0AAN9F1H4_CROPI